MNRSRSRGKTSNKLFDGAFTFSTGELSIGSGLTLAPGQVSNADLITAGWNQLDSHNEWAACGISWVSIWHHHFAVSARFRNKELAVLDLLWRDGSRLKEDWSATDEDLLKEKKALAKLISTEADTTAVATSLGVDTFAFNWGTVSVRADQRSMLVMTSIHYSK